MNSLHFASSIALSIILLCCQITSGRFLRPKRQNAIQASGLQGSSGLGGGPAFAMDMNLNAQMSAGGDGAGGGPAFLSGGGGNPMNFGASAGGGPAFAGISNNGGGASAGPAFQGLNLPPSGSTGGSAYQMTLSASQS